ncbi:MAG: amidohydrolase [Clostridiales Family XIII bacterium]|jgi:predicted TIM-barrel fold metal-dependent hydrolase|nr:amidohydrolase [Clostridiales Family XIII bacterium]
MMIIDAQNHILPLEYSRFFEKHSKYPTVTMNGNDAVIDYAGTQKFVCKQSDYSPEASVEMMDKNEIDLALISPQIPCCTLLPGELAAEGARIVNDAIQDAIEKYPGRFKGIGFLPWNLPDRAIRETHRLKKLGFVGVMLCSQIGDNPADLPVYHPIYSELAKLGLVIFLHPMVPPWGKYISDYSMIPMMGFMVNESFCLMRLILSGIVEQNPSLRIVMPHCGGILPALSGRIWNQTVNMHRGMEQITVPPVDVLKSDRIWYDLVSPDPGSMKFITDFLGGADRLMFSTDFPWVDTPILLRQVKEAFPDESDQKRVFSGTVKALLGI